MCTFCAQHGDGEKWYLEAQNYSADLTEDLRRRQYLVDFLQGFDAGRAKIIAGMWVLDAMPAALGRFAKDRLSRSLQEHHFGQPVPIEDVERVLDITTSIVQIPCPCRRFAGLSEEGYCFAVTTRPVDDVLAEGFSTWQEVPDVSSFQRLTKTEALEKMRSLENKGLMHSVWTFVTPFVGAICNCNLSSGCMAMRITREFGTKIMWKGHYVARADADACTGCRACEKLCPFDAIETRDRKAVVRERDCWGCGICRSACTRDAISLLDRAAVPEVAAIW